MSLFTILYRTLALLKGCKQAFLISTKVFIVLSILSLPLSAQRLDSSQNTFPDSTLLPETDSLTTYSEPSENRQKLNEILRKVKTRRQVFNYFLAFFFVSALLLTLWVFYIVWKKPRPRKRD